MATNITFNGASYTVPAIGDASWGLNLSNYLVAIASGSLQKTGGTFTLTSEADFGSTYGLKAPYFKSKAPSPALLGFLRLAVTETLSWRNNANSADLALAVNGSDQLTFAGVRLLVSGGVVNADVAAGAAIAYSKLNLAGSVTNADLAGSIADSKLNTISTAGKVANSATTAVSTNTASTIVARDGGGNFSAGTVTASLTGAASLNVLKTGDAMSGLLTLSADPTSALHAATKNYVDTVAQGLTPKAAVLCATTANITLSGEQTIDGVATSASRVLVKNQTTTANNGIYLSSAGAWTRVADMSSWTQVPSAYTFVEEGSTNADTGWVCTSDPGGTLGTTAITWTQFAGAGTYTAGSGLTLSGNQFAVSTGGIVNAMVSASAAIAYSKLALAGSILNTDLAGAIADSKLNTITTAGKVSNSATTATNTAGTASAIVARDASGNLNSEKLSAAVVLDEELFTETTDPSSPTAGQLAVYAKSDHKLYTKNSAGVVTAVGTGSGSGGIVNDIANPDGETGTTAGWAAYLNTAQSTPVNGTGGAPTVTFNVYAAAGFAGTYATSGTSPLRGTYSFELGKTAVNSQGQGASYAFSIDRADISKVLQISFDFEASSTGYSASDVGVYIYDVTNSTLITPSTVGIPTGKGTFQAVFSATTSTSYRLIFHVSTTNAAAYYLKLDSVTVTPNTATMGPAISDWQTYVATGQWTTNTTYTGRWRRVGDMMELYVHIALSGAPATGDLLVYLPSGYTIDTSKVATSTALQGHFGTGRINHASANTAISAIWYSTINYGVGLAHDDQSTGNSGVINPTQPFTFASGDFIDVWFSVPIANWSSNVQLGTTNVEFASNSSTTNGADTTSFVNGLSGSLVPTITAAAGTARADKTVQFATPIQPSDSLVLEVQMAGSGAWVPHDKAQYANFSAVNGTRYGMRILSTTTNTAVVTFAIGGANTSDSTTTVGGVGANYPVAAGDRWRVRKSAGVNVNALVGDRLGVSDSSVAASGYVGEYKSSNPGGSVTPGATGVWVNITTLTLTPGDWDVSGLLNLTPGTLSGCTRFMTGISTSSATVDSTNVGGIQSVASVSPTPAYLGTGTRRISVGSGTQIVYLVGFMDYSSLGTAVYGAVSFLQARRMR